MTRRAVLPEAVSKGRRDAFSGATASSSSSALPKDSRSPSDSQCLASKQWRPALFSKQLLVLPLVVAAGLGTPAVRAESPQQPKIVELRAGFDGHFKVGCWTPFKITLQGGHRSVTGHVELIVSDCDGVPSRVQTLPKQPVSLDAGENVTVTLFAKIGQLGSGATVRFRDSGDSLPTQRIELYQAGPFAGILPSNARLIVTLGGPLASFEDSHFDEREVTVVDLPDFAALPERWWGLEGVDAVMLATGGDEVDPLLTTDSPQLVALDQWVRMGGTLVISAGRSAKALLGAGMPLTRLAPGHSRSWWRACPARRWKPMPTRPTRLPARRGDSSWTSRGSR